MSDRTLLAKILRLVASDEVETQLAATVVLARVGARDAAVVSALLPLLESPVPALQRRAALALGAAGARKALPALLTLLQARDPGVRAAAMDAVASFGEAALPALRERLPAAADKRPIEELLARLGGRDAVATLLESLPADDLEGARAAVLPLRQRLKDAGPRERKSTLAQALRFVKNKRAAPAARLAATRLVGFVADRSGAPALLAVARSTDPEPLREEAVIALRLCGVAGDRKIAEALVGLAEKAPLRVARAALYGLGALPAALGKRIGQLALHPESARALVAIELLGALGGADAAQALARVLAQTDERARAEAAAGALAKRPEAGAALARALLAAADRDRAELLARLLRPQLAQPLDRKLIREIVDTAVERFAAAAPAAETLLQVARAVDAAGIAEALRDLAARLRKTGKLEPALRALRMLARSRDAAPDDGYALAALELVNGLKDEAFTIIGQLLDQGYDVAAALRKDRSLEDRHRYEVGFHFVERDHPLGEEVLTAVAARGRSKVAQMARAKLKSAGL